MEHLNSSQQSRLFRPGLIREPVFTLEIPSIFQSRTQPARLHTRSKRQSNTYHERIQKKWNKRFGLFVWFSYEQ